MSNIPNLLLQKVIQDTKAGINCASFSTVEELFKDLGISDIEESKSSENNEEI